MRIACVALLALPGTLSAQAGVSAAGQAGIVRVTMGSGLADQRGAVVGGTVGLTASGVFVTARYAQGSVTPDGGSTTTTLVLGEVKVGVSPFDWLSFSAGPLAFAYERPAIERWVLWEATGRLSAPLIGDVARSFVEVRRSFATQSTIAGDPSGSGIAVGLVIRPPLSPLSGSLSYRVDHAEIAGGPARTMDQLWLTVRLGGPDLP